MTPVFADAFYYIALLNSADRFHIPSALATQRITSPLITPIWVLMEVADALSAPTVRKRTHQFLHQVATDPNTLVLADHEPWYARGVQLYGSRNDKAWSLTDCISFEVMTDHGIRDALTGDHHFVQAGFRALLLPSAR